MGVVLVNKYARFSSFSGHSFELSLTPTASRFLDALLCTLELAHGLIWYVLRSSGMIESLKGLVLSYLLMCM
jgi:hypothetical protein